MSIDRHRSGDDNLSSDGIWRAKYGLLRKKFSRSQRQPYIAMLAHSVIGQEECSGVHSLGGKLGNGVPGRG